MQTLFHTAQSLFYASIPLGQITHAVVAAFPAGHAIIPDADSLAHAVDRGTELLEKLFIHVAVFLYLLKKSAGELAKLLKGAWKSVLMMAGVVAPIGRLVARAVQAVVNAIVVIARRVSAVASTLIRQIKKFATHRLP